MISHLITELQSLGLRFDGQLTQRRGGAGPSEGGTLLIHDRPVSLPTSSNFVQRSPYVLREEGGQYLIVKDEKPLCPANFIKRPKFYDCLTKDGIPYQKIALLHGKDCLATTVIQTCSYWNSDKRCQFCGIELSYNSGKTLKIKTPVQLAEVARKAKELDGITHVVLTIGTLQPFTKEIFHLARCANAIKEATGLPIHAQCSPPPDSKKLYELKESGVDTLGIHIESFDVEVLSKVAPAKAAFGLKRYEEAWKEALEIFGPNQVSSFIIIGLGEKLDSVIEGSELLTDLGVYPFVLPFRPIPGSLMEAALPPDPGEMKRIYESVASILKRKGLSSFQSLAGCVRCGACSALPAYELEMDRLVCHPVRTKAELALCLKIRKEVFVKEQKIFSNSDLDENDARSTHLVTQLDNQIIGTVRVFPVDEKGHWVGGRLAVKKEYRNTGAGELLVREAMRFVKRQGCTKFTAHIQEKNVPFFLSLGWKPVRRIENYCGRPHQLMEANLEDI